MYNRKGITMEIKKKREYIIVIIALSFTLLCCIAYIIYDKSISKSKYDFIKGQVANTQEVITIN